MPWNFSNTVSKHLFRPGHFGVRKVGDSFISLDSFTMFSFFDKRTVCSYNTMRGRILCMGCVKP